MRVTWRASAARLARYRHPSCASGLLQLWLACIDVPGDVRALVKSSDDMFCGLDAQLCDPDAPKSPKLDA